MKKMFLVLLLAAGLITGCAKEAKASPTNNGGSAQVGQSVNVVVLAPQGVQGVQGVAGSPGATGATGATGVQGVAGEMNYRIMNYGLAAASALANIPDDLGVDDTSVGVGAGFYADQNALAVGLTHRYSESFAVKASVAQSLTNRFVRNGNNTLWGVGAAYRF